MKFAIFYEYDIEDMEQIIEKWNEILKVEEGDYTKIYPQFLTDAYLFNGQTSGIQLCETDDPEKMNRLAMFWSPVLRMEYIPLIETSNAIEIWKANR